MSEVVVSPAALAAPPLAVTLTTASASPSPPPPQSQSHPSPSYPSQSHPSHPLLQPRCRRHDNKSFFGDCALIEIIHLHDCLRGALQALESDVRQLDESIQKYITVTASSGTSSPSSPSLSSSSKAAGTSTATETSAEQDTPALDPSRPRHAIATSVSETEAPSPSSNKKSSFVPSSSVILEMERRLTSRFKVIWSVFRSHSAAEDEFIWPALTVKIAAATATPTSTNNTTNTNTTAAAPPTPINISSAASTTCSAENEATVAAMTGSVVTPTLASTIPTTKSLPSLPCMPLPPSHPISSPCATTPAVMIIQEEEYVEDHADEERMFSAMDALLIQLRAEIVQAFHRRGRGETTTKKNQNTHHQATDPIHMDPHHVLMALLSKELCSRVATLVQHLHTHLDKEETKCLPLVVEYLSREEIHDLVGHIMGQRSADTMAHIMDLAVQNLDDVDRADMIGYMRQSMAGTYFDKWLQMSGWMMSVSSSSTSSPYVKRSSIGTSAASYNSSNNSNRRWSTCPGLASRVTGAAEATGSNQTYSSSRLIGESESKMEPRWSPPLKRPRHDSTTTLSDARSTSATLQKSASAGESSAQCVDQGQGLGQTTPSSAETTTTMMDATTQKELEKLVCAVSWNSSLTKEQKNTTIQGLRDSVAKLHQRRDSVEYDD